MHAAGRQPDLVLQLVLRVPRDSSQPTVPIGANWMRSFAGRSPNTLANIAVVVRLDEVALGPAAASKPIANARSNKPRTTAIREIDERCDCLLLASCEPSSRGCFRREGAGRAVLLSGNLVTSAATLDSSSGSDLVRMVRRSLTAG